MSTHTILVSLNEIGRLKEVTAAAAAMAGLTKWVRPPLP